ncbi:ABC transporter permease [Diaphorobacter sp. NR2-3-3-1]|nr:ABC transporter permease [Diaphorobacter caeni]
MKLQKLSRVAQYLWLGLLFAFIAMPMLIIVWFSFDANRYPGIPWGGFSLQWHRAILEDEMVLGALVNTLVVAISTAVISTALGFAAAYLDYRYRFRGKATMAMLIAIPPAIPATVLGMAMLAFLSRIGMLGKLESIIACHAVIATSFSMAIIRLRLNELGADLEQAAWNMGASPIVGLTHVVLPFCKSSLIASFFLAAAVSFDEFMIAWFVGGMNETLPVRILNLLQGQVSPKINAIGTLVLLVSVVLVMLAQRFMGVRAGRPAAMSA